MLITVWECVFGIHVHLFYYKCILQHDEEPTAQVMNLAHLLETCQFREFWVNKILLLLFFSLLQSHCFVILLWMKYFLTQLSFAIMFVNKLIHDMHVHVYFHFFPHWFNQGSPENQPWPDCQHQGVWWFHKKM